METLTIDVMRILQAVIMGAASLLIWSHRHAFRGGGLYFEFVQLKREHAELVKEFGVLQQDVRGQFAEANTRSSRAMSELQARLSDLYTRREIDLMASESQRDRKRLQDDISELWRVVNARRRADGD